MGSFSTEALLILVSLPAYHHKDVVLQIANILACPSIGDSVDGIESVEIEGNLSNCGAMIFHLTRRERESHE
jgi:hypothetical protein